MIIFQDSFNLHFPDHLRMFKVLKMILSCYYSVVKKRENLKFAGKKKELEIIILSEVT